ncbi:hypothetical protein M0R45_000127 [Rubus argutus]|uniref:Uncharacterized protein n=1 Tax=Rubus argutus TaxID=59490 RepID=A0AAW1VMD3_RUBAR
MAGSACASYSLAKVRNDSLTLAWVVSMTWVGAALGGLRLQPFYSIRVVVTIFWCGGRVGLPPWWYRIKAGPKVYGFYFGRQDLIGDDLNNNGPSNGVLPACFGFSKKRKRRRLSNRVAAAGGDYVNSLTYLQPQSEPIIRQAEGGDELQDQKESQLQSECPNLRAYFDRLSFLESDVEEEEEVEKNGREVSKGSLSASASKRASTAMRS